MKKRSVIEQAKRLTFRLDDELASGVAELAEATGIAPNLLGRMAVIVFVKNRLHELPERMYRIESTTNQLNESVIRLIKDFNDAVVDEVG